MREKIEAQRPALLSWNGISPPFLTREYVVPVADRPRPAGGGASGTWMVGKRPKIWEGECASYEKQTFQNGCPLHIHLVARDAWRL
jgi:hypothetical protein